MMASTEIFKLLGGEGGDDLVMVYIYWIRWLRYTVY